MFRRATYYLRPDQIKALKLRAAAEERQLSDVMREAVDLYLRQRPVGPRAGRVAAARGGGGPD
jgi:hypothetical protein